MAGQPASSGSRRQLTVVVGAEPVALPGDAVLEVLRRPRLTRVPHGPPALMGVCNLRGSVLPVVSLARLLGEEAGPETRVVVLDHKGRLGLLVDDVLKLGAADIVAAGRQVDLVALLDAGFARPDTAQAPAVRTAAITGAETVQTRQDERVLLSFLVRAQTFALPLTAVIEVLRPPAHIAPVARAEPATVGIIDVRDRSLPIVSLAVLLGFTEQHTKQPGDRILVVERDGAWIGLLADGIESILRLPEAAIDPVPAILKRGRGEAELDAIGRPGGRRPLVSILSVPKLFADASRDEAVAAASPGTAAASAEFGAERREQFVVFDLGGERYGIPIGSVDEVLRLPGQVTRLPNGPPFITGIINIRGRPVPIIDQRYRFDAPTASGALQPRVIIVSFGTLRAGFVVDGVAEILAADSAELAATPPLSSERAVMFDRAANAAGGLILLVNPEELLSRAERDVLADITARQTAAGAT